MPRQKSHPLVKQVQICVLACSQHSLSICSFHGSGHAVLCHGLLWCPLLYWPTTCCLLPFLQGAVVLHMDLNSLTGLIPGPAFLPSLLPGDGSDSRSLLSQPSTSPAAMNRAMPNQFQTQTRLPFWDLFPSAVLCWFILNWFVQYEMLDRESR